MSITEHIFFIKKGVLISEVTRRMLDHPMVLGIDWPSGAWVLPGWFRDGCIESSKSSLFSSTSSFFICFQSLSQWWWFRHDAKSSLLRQVRVRYLVSSPLTEQHRPFRSFRLRHLAFHQRSSTHRSCRSFYCTCHYSYRTSQVCDKKFSKRITYCRPGSLRVANDAAQGDLPRIAAF